MASLYKMPILCQACGARHIDVPIRSGAKHPGRCRVCDSTRLIYSPEEPLEPHHADH